ncbi:hypothetical protein Hte_007407 [Hypoxylon texense]
MDNNSSSSGNGDNVGNTGLDSATLAGVVSTVITFVALIVSSIQLLYQYYTNVSLNALGARNCNERVMGPWARATRRRWRWLELRFEIIFESPVLFVAPVTNTKGPVPGRPIWYMDGSVESCEETRTIPLASTDAARYPTTTGVRRSINVEATWVTLLQTLQSMESSSKSWHDQVSGYNIGLPPISPPFHKRSLAVAVQAQTLSWDFVPNFKKPFATSTISHIVEIAAMLGIHWTMWDPTADRYRAEGNGFTLMGSFIAEQGIVFQLIKHDRTAFGENRLIPNDDIKKYCFGFVPTLYQQDESARFFEKESRGAFPADPILPLLKLGSRQEVMETLMDVGLPIQIAEYFLSEDSRVSHLFPVIFDVLGMLGCSVSVKGYCYRMLPNPTVFRFDRRWFRTQRLLLEFKIFIEKIQSLGGRTSGPLNAIESALGRLYPYLQDSSSQDYSYLFLEALREAIQIVDYRLKGPGNGEAETPSEIMVLEVVRDHVACIVADLRKRPSHLLDKFPLGRKDNGAGERNYIAFLFDRCRYAVTHHYRHDTLHDELDSEELGQYEYRHESARSKETERPDAGRREITWCLLVFRMLCWLQLHDFHRDDVMIPRSATFGSRMPVYII